MKKKLISAVILLLLLATALVYINRDLMHFEYAYHAVRTFMPEEDAKGRFMLTETFVLKPGEYALTFEGDAGTYGNSVFLENSDGTVLTGYELNAEPEQRQAFTVAGSPVNVRIGFSYDPTFGNAEVRRISVTSDHVLYKESLLRHAVISLLLSVLAVLIWVRICIPGSFKFLCGENERLLVFFVLLSAVLCLPLLLPDSFGITNDAMFHMSRILGKAESLANGYFPVYDELFWLKDYGYGTGYFYPGVLLYFPAVLNLLGFPILTCYKTFIAVCTFLSLCSFYIAAKRISGSRGGAIAAVLLYGFCAYRAICVFYRGALGEVQAFIFLPLIVLGLYEMFNDRPDRWWIFAFGFWGLLSCHLISIVTAALGTAVYLLCRIRTIFRDRRILFGLIKSVIAVMLVSASFLIPMAEQLQYGSLKTNLLLSAEVGSTDLHQAMPWKWLFTFFHDWSFNANWQRCVYPGWMLLLVPLSRIPLCFQKKRFRAADTMLLAGIIYMICATNLFPWRTFSWMLNRMQFSWRMLLEVSALLPLAASVYFREYFEKKHTTLALAILAVGCSVCAFPIYRDTIVNRTVSEDEFIMQDNRAMGEEYLPQGLTAEFIDKNADTVLYDTDAEILSHKRRGLSFTFAYTNAGEDTEFIVPMTGYYGFKGELTDESGNKSELPVERSANGLLSVHAGGDGTIRVWLAKTTAQRVSECVTLCAVVCIAIYCLRRRRKSRAGNW